MKIESNRCDKCKSCCHFFRTVPPKLTDDEVQELSRVLKMPPKDIVRAKRHKEGGWALLVNDDGSCIFSVDEGNHRRCSIQHCKPLECSLYPVFTFVDSLGRKCVGIDMFCPIARDGGFSVDVQELLGDSRTFKFTRGEKVEGGRSVIIRVTTAKIPTFVLE